MGSNTQISTCKIPTIGNRVSVICSAGTYSSTGSDTTIVPCSSASITDGKYVSTMCTQTSSSQVGAEVQVSACTLPSNGQGNGYSYTIAACIQGSTTLLGVDTVIGTCSCIKQNMYQSGVSYYFSVVCNPGSYSSLGSNCQSLPCTTPAIGIYYIYIYIIENYNFRKKNIPSHLLYTDVRMLYIFS